MKQCPKCQNKYNDNWEICIKDNERLEADSGSVTTTVMEAPKKSTKPIEGQRYFYVSPLRFAFFSILTFSLYITYWCYRNWKLIRNQEQRKISPFWRAWFTYLWIYGLFENIKKSKNVGRYSSGALAGAFIGLEFIGHLSSRVANDNLSWAMWGVSFFSFVAILPVLDAIKMFNQMNNIDPAEDKRVTTGQIVLIVCGAVVWLLTIAGMVMLAT
jgi:hypothetical protein